MPWWRPSAPRAGSGPRVEVVSRQGCHLCQEMIDVVRRAVGPEVPVHLVDLDASPVPGEARERWTTLVPVLLVDGREVAHWRVDERTVRAAVGPAGRSLPARVLVRRRRRP